MTEDAGLREEATAVQDERLLDHDRHLAEINGSVREAAERLGAIEVRLTSMEGSLRWLIAAEDNQPSSSRRYRVARYAIWTSVGVAFSLQVPRLLATGIGIFTSLWVAMLAVGSVLCLVGAITDRWIFEYYMLVVMQVSVGSLAGVLLLSPNGTPARIGIGLAFVVVTVDFWQRWREVVALARHERARIKEG